MWSYNCTGLTRPDGVHRDKSTVCFAATLQLAGSRAVSTTENSHITMCSQKASQKINGGHKTYSVFWIEYVGQTSRGINVTLLFIK
jgi:hypothetical protein